jgi:hypothetical protein
MSEGIYSVGYALRGEEQIIPSSIRFRTLRTALPAKRVPIKIRAEQTSYTSNQNKLIKINFPVNIEDLIDTRKGYLTFDTQIATVGGTYVRVQQGIYNIFNRIRLRIGGYELEDIRDYNKIYSLLWEMIQSPDTTANIGYLNMGFGTQYDRNNLSGNNVVTGYTCPVMSGIFTQELLPLGVLKQGLCLELYIEDPTVSLETDSSSQVVTISNIQFHCERLELKKSFQAYVNNYIRTKGLKLGFTSWEHYTNILSAGVNTQIALNHRSSSVSTVINFLLPSSQNNNTLINDRHYTFLKYNLSEASILFEGRLFPDEPYDANSPWSIELYQSYARWINRWTLQGFLLNPPPINIQAFNTSKFFVLFDFEAYPEEVDIINPFNTIRSNNALDMRFKFSTSVPSGMQMDSWVEYYTIIEIYADGMVRKSY